MRDLFPDSARVEGGELSVGGLWVSEDAGASWECLSRDLPPIAVVRFS